MQSILITGSSGLIGSAVAEAFGTGGFAVHGIDNNQRRVFFGPPGDNSRTRERLQASAPRYVHHDLDIRERDRILDLVRSTRPACIVHCAAQPSHDLAARIPFDDFEINATGTLNLLEAARRYCPDSPFVHLSTNKVYGDAPNRVDMREHDTRWDYSGPAFEHGIPETFPIDHCTHSLFGASKLAADVMVQEYGRYFGMPTVSLRCGCLTGPGHSGVELHGFLSYLLRCNVEGREYRVHGYGGKQVRDNIHAADVAGFILEYFRSPRAGEVYNLGGGKENACSILEAFSLAAEITGKQQIFSHSGQHRVGDHICYYSDLRKIRAHYPGWRIEHPLESIFTEIAAAWHDRLKCA